MTRRSWASGALDSSIDWFWQTTQRSSCESLRARASRAGSLSISPGSTAPAGVRAQRQTRNTRAARRNAGWVRRSADPTLRRMADSERRTARESFAIGHSRIAPQRVLNIGVSLRGRDGGQCLLAHPAGSADAQAPVREREEAAQGHQEGAEPDQPDQGIEIEAHDEAAIGELVAQCRVQIAPPGDVDGRLGGDLPRRIIEPLGRAKLDDGRAVPGDGEERRLLAVVWALARTDAAEGEGVAGDLAALAGLHGEHSLALPGAGGDHADDC